MQYIISGSKKLKGEIKLAGNKNSLHLCMAGALLTKEEVILENLPDIRDGDVLKQILEELGAKVKKDGNSITIKAEKIKSNLPQDLMIRLRGAIVFVGVLLARFGEVHFYFPGGDTIGKRSIDDHIDGLTSLGASFWRKDLEFRAKYKSSDLNDTVNIFMLLSSVTGTANIILASVLGNRKVVLKNCAQEPQIIDLCKMLVSMGAKINGIGTDTLIISGVDRLHGTRFRLGVDHIEMGTYAVAAAITNGEVTINGIDKNSDLDPVLVPLSRFGIIYKRVGSKITFRAKSLTAIEVLKTNIRPGFPTDLMSAAIVLSTQAQGVTLCHDWMYESRMFFVDKLISMGAKIIIADPHRVLVYGPTQLRAREVETPDIRAGMALVLAALISKGVSIINKAELIERGYEDVVGKLSKLGAGIKKIE